MRSLLLLVLSPLSVVLAADIGSYWREGKAELDGYRLRVSRYGETRHGQAVLVYVTEPFSASKFVKLDDASKNPGDVVDVLKLNLVRDFQTGIYDYNTMVSVFARTDTFAPVKTSFSSAEWCGHVYDELLFHPNDIQSQFLSYFEGESRKVVFERPADGIAEDHLFILLRGLREDFLAPGKAANRPLLPSPYFCRLNHKPMAWSSVTIRREPKSESVEVPAGKFEAMRYALTFGDGRRGVFLIDTAYPHRIVRWELLPDVSAELTGTARLPYWQLHNAGDEKYLDKLGLKPTVE